MVTANLQVPQIGTGLYTPQEAATFAKLRTETFNRWFFEEEAPLRPRIQPANGERLVTFWDLIQAVAVRNLRKSPKTSRISLQLIRTVVRECEEKGYEFPLAREHRLYWFSNRLILKTDDDQYIGLKPGTDLNQLYNGIIIEPFLKEVQFIDKLAHTWTPLESAHFSVNLNADRRFGMPIIEPGGILVSALTDAVESEGSIEAAADAFEIETEAVLLALKYHEYLASAA